MKEDWIPVEEKLPLEDNSVDITCYITKPNDRRFMPRINKKFINLDNLIEGVLGDKTMSEDEIYKGIMEKITKEQDEKI